MNQSTTTRMATRHRRLRAGALSATMSSIFLALAGCSGYADDARSGDAPDLGLEHLPVSSALEQEVDTLLVAVAAGGDVLGRVEHPEVQARFAQLEAAVSNASVLIQQLNTARAAKAPSSEGAAALTALDRLAAQVPPQVRRIKHALVASGADAETLLEAGRALDTIKVAAVSLGAGLAQPQVVGEQPGTLGLLGGSSGVGSAWHVLSQGHIDAIDVAYEDGALGISIHDESVVPDVERDPARTILLVKGSARVQVPDGRFAFLGRVGANVWILPEGQAEAEAAGVLWAGIATAEVASGVFVSDQVQVRFTDVQAPDGFSLFESPEDELSRPNILVDSEDGLPDTIMMPVGVHRHMNWAFESPGVYRVSVRARGRLARLPGNPWVRSEAAVLRFVVLP